MISYGPGFTSASPESFKLQKQPSEVFLAKVVPKICSKVTGEHSCRSVISIKLLCYFIEIALWHSCSPESLLHIFGTAFPNNTCGRLLLKLLVIS